jgi:hypothetical protein
MATLSQQIGHESRGGAAAAFRRISLRLQNSAPLVALSSLVFAALQSVCTFFAAMDGLRTVLGISSLVLAESTSKAIDSFHVDWLRVPMIALALVGAVLNLIVIWQIRRLRRNPAARWRQRPVSPAKLRMERVQTAMAVLTLILLAVEERQHLIWVQHL